MTTPGVTLAGSGLDSFVAGPVYGVLVALLMATWLVLVLLRRRR